MDTIHHIPTCPYCQVQFRAKNGLTQHLRTVKACIAAQQADGLNIKVREYVCDACNKSLTSKSSMDYHLRVCKVRAQQLLEAERAEKEAERAEKEALMVRLEHYDSKLEQLQEKVQELETKPTASKITNNNMKNSHNTNTTNNHITIQNWMTEDRVMEIFQKNFKRIEQLNPKELAHFTVNHLVNGQDRPLYLCTDPSRQRMVYFDGSGNEQVDESCKTLIEKVLQAKPFVDEIIQDDIVDKTEEEIVKVKPYHDAFSNLQQSRNYKLELSKQLPRTVESARKPKRTAAPPPDGDGWENGVDWKINDKMKPKPDTSETDRKKQIEETENHDVWGFFPVNADDEE